MSNNLLIIPLAFMVMAVIFSPIGVSINPSCSVNPLQTSCLGDRPSIVNNPNCQTNEFNNPSCAISVQFLNNVSVAFTPQGYSYQAAASKQLCESVKINGVSITQIPILGTLTQLPILGNIADFFIGLGQAIQQTVVNSITGTNTISSPTPDACLAAAGSIILLISFTGQDILLLFVGAVFTAAAVAALSSLVLNAGGAVIIFETMSLGLIFLILTALGYATWATIPSPFGSFIYTIVTLSFALGMITEVRGVLP